MSLKSGRVKPTEHDDGGGVGADGGDGDDTVFTECKSSAY